MVIFPDDPLARFLLQKNQFRSTDNSVKHNVFMPARDGDLSVFRISNLDNSEIHNIGREYVASPRNKTLVGHARIIASDATSRGLEVIEDQTSHPLHANITNWPGSEKDRAIAVFIAARAKLELV